MPSSSTNSLRIPEELDRILILASEPNTPHFETSLDMAMILASEGREVHFRYILTEHHEFFDVQPSKSTLLKWVRKGLDTAIRCEPRIKSIDIVTARDLSCDPSLLHSAFFDINDAIQSSQTSRRHPGKFGTHADAFLQRSGQAVFCTSVTLIQQIQPDLVIFFNGRFVHSRAVWRAAESQGIAWASHERGGSDFLFRLEIGATAHDSDRLKKRYDKYYSQSFMAFSHNSLADDLSRAAAKQRSLAGFSWTGQAISPVDVAYFSSSYAEYGHSGYSYFAAWETETEAFSALARVCSSMGLTLALRLHPNMVNFGPDELTRWNRTIASVKPSAVLLPDNLTSSYDLLQSCSVIATGFSTIGVEASLSRKPVINLANAPYRDGIESSWCRTEKEIRSALELRRPTNAVGGLAYLQFMQTFGFHHVNYASTGSHSGTLCGVHLGPNAKGRISKIRRRSVRQLLQICARFAVTPARFLRRY